MRFLRNVTIEEVNDIIERSSDKMLIYVRNAPAGIPSVGIIHGGGIPVNGLTFVFDSLGTKLGTYTYDYDATMTINNYLYAISEDHPELNMGWDVYNAPSAPRHTLQLGTPIGELGINEGDTLYCYEIFD